MPGQQQSPINISGHVEAHFARPLKIRWSKKLSGELIRRHGKVSVTFNGDSRQKISFDGNDFHILQFHFHHKSEHWVNGKQYPMELHIVHQNCDSSKGGFAVLGILIEPEGGLASCPSLIDEIESAYINDAREVTEFTTNPRDWLPQDTKKYWRYEGSLTTPEYDESVSWVVFKDTLRLQQTTLKRLIQYAGEPARLPQPLSRRFVLGNFK